MRAIRALVLCLCAAAATGGCAPRARVLYEAGPRPLGARTIVVEPLAFAGVRVGRLAAVERIGRKSAAPSARRGVEARLDDRFAARLGSALDGGTRLPVAGHDERPWTIRALLTERYLEPGYQQRGLTPTTRLDLRAEILDPGGRLVEVLALDDTIDARIDSPAGEARLGRALDRFADRLAARLR